MTGIDPAAAVWLSLKVALATVVFSAPFAVAFGWLLARRSFPGKWLFSSLVMVPMVLPPVVTGFLLLDLMGPNAALGSFLAGIGVRVAFAPLGAVVAAATVSMPLYVLSMRTAFEAVDARYEGVSYSLGIDRPTTFRRITLPLALPGFAAGAVLTFARALGEFGATVVLAGNMEGETRTIALAIYTLLESPGGMEAARLLTWLSVALSLAALVGYEAFTRWQRGRLEVDNGR